MEVSTADLAEVLGLGERRIQQLAGIGVFRRLGHGEWLLPECVQAYIEHRVKSETGKLAKTVASGADRLKEIKARREELKLAREERALVPFAESMAEFDRIIGIIRLGVNNLPARHTRDLNERDRLQVGIDDIFLDVARELAQSRRLLCAGDEPPAPEEEDDA